jgi:hypothetical protein
MLDTRITATVVLLAKVHVFATQTVAESYRRRSRANLDKSELLYAARLNDAVGEDVKQFVLVAAFLPLVAFCVAGVTELRAQRSGAEKLRSLIPIVLGIAVFGLSLSPQAIFQVTPSSSVTLSRVMTMVSAVVACSGVFVSFSRRSSAVWVACGGLVLAFFWMFNRIVA